jgi:CHAT domain-containing protein
MFNRIRQWLHHRQKVPASAPSSSHEQVSAGQSGTAEPELTGGYGDMRNDIQQRLSELHQLRADLFNLSVTKRERPRFLETLRETRNDQRRYLKSLMDYGKDLALRGRLGSACRAFRVGFRLSGRNDQFANLHTDFAAAYVGTQLTRDEVPPLQDLESYLQLFALPTAAIFRAQISLKAGNIAEADKWAQEAVDSSEDAQSPTLFEALLTQAEIREQQGNLMDALYKARAAVAVAERALGFDQSGQRGSVRNSLTLAAEYYARLHLAYEDADAWELLTVIDKAKGRLLLETLAENVGLVPSNIPEPFKAREKSALFGLRSARYEANHTYPATAAQRLRESSARAELWKLLDSYPPEFEHYVRYRKGQNLPPRECLQSLGGAHPNTYTVVFYQLPEGLIRIFVDCAYKVIKRDIIAMEGAELDKLIEEFSEYCKIPNSKIRERSRFLFEILFGNVLTDVPRGANLLIVPSRKLYKVSFAALWVQDEYLINKYPISTLPCLSVTNSWQRRRFPSGRLVIADSLGDLPRAKEESKSVAELLNTRAIIGSEVQRDILERLLPDCYFLHIASHGRLDESVPGFSGFPLADTTIVSAQDLADIEFNCRIAFLSSCSTGDMSYVYEDDPLSIGTTLLAAGAESVIFTLWEIDDTATKDLVLHFYETVLKGNSLNVSLAGAQRHVLNRGRYSHPYYWGAFQLMGDWAPVIAHNGQMVFG